MFLLQALLEIPLLRPKALLVVSSLIHGLCQQEQGPCNDIAEVQQFVRVLKQSLDAGCEVDDHLQITEVQSVLSRLQISVCLLICFTSNVIKMTYFR